jgi:CMP-2-keto-3-deoxyoctulosonic acid synthetase
LAIVGIIPARYGSERLPGETPSDTHGEILMVEFSAYARAAERPDRAESEDGARVDTPADPERAPAPPAPGKGKLG